MAHTIAAPLVAKIVDAATARGVPKRVAEEAVGVPRARLGAEARVPIVRVYELFAVVLRRLDDPGFPLAVARTVTFDDYSVLGFALERATTAKEAFERLARYGHVISDSARWSMVERGPSLELRFVREGKLGLGHRAANECAIAELLGGIARAFGNAVVPRETHFRHAAPRDTSSHRAFFGRRIVWGSTWNGIVVARDVLAQRPHAGDESLSRFFASLLDRERTAPGTSLATRVRERLVHDLPSGVPTAVELATRLGMSDRTFRRALDGEGTSYRDLVEDHRKGCAEDLRRAGKSATETAFLLGFSETSAFSRAYRRWFGRSWRASRGGAPRNAP